MGSRLVLHRFCTHLREILNSFCMGSARVLNNSCIDVEQILRVLYNNSDWCCMDIARDLHGSYMHSARNQFWFQLILNWIWKMSPLNLYGFRMDSGQIVRWSCVHKICMDAERLVNNLVWILQGFSFDSGLILHCICMGYCFVLYGLSRCLHGCSLSSTWIRRKCCMGSSLIPHRFWTDSAWILRKKVCMNFALVSFGVCLDSVLNPHWFCIGFV